MELRIYKIFSPKIKQGFILYFNRYPVFMFLWQFLNENIDYHCVNCKDCKIKLHKTIKSNDGLVAVFFYYYFEKFKSTH